MKIIFVQLLMEAAMAGKTKRAALVLTPEQKAMLDELSRSRTAQAREVERAKVLLGYAGGNSITELQRQLGVGRPMIYKCIDKALATGVQMGLKDKYHRPHEPEISDEAKAWVVSLACTKASRENKLINFSFVAAGSCSSSRHETLPA